MSALDIRVATLNISGGEKTFEEFPHETQQSRREALGMVIRHLDAGVLCLQEMSEVIDAEGVTHTLMDRINQVGNYHFSFYGKTVSMQTHMQVKKEIMVSGIFMDWWDWSKGNAIHARIPFSRLGDPARPGIPRNIPLYQPVSYEGNRDTEPRFVLIARLKQPPYPFIATLHLTTLVGERTPQANPERVKQAQALRVQQIERFLDLVRIHILMKDEPLILAGDFNAMEDERCLAGLSGAENGFVRLVPENNTPTHPALAKPIDHIFFFPRHRLVDYTCHIETGDLSRRVSDHLPVVADIRLE